MITTNETDNLFRLFRVHCNWAALSGFRLTRVLLQFRPLSWDKLHMSCLSLSNLFPHPAEQLAFVSCEHVTEQTQRLIRHSGK